jgi:hypothetical protein
MKGSIAMSQRSVTHQRRSARDKSPTARPRRRRDLGDPQEASERPSEATIDETLDESFPASDPPSWSGPERIGPPLRKRG